MNKSVLTQTIKASKEKVWEVLFNQYGDIHIHNPTMQASNYLDNTTKGALNAIRYCEFTDKLNMDEKITEVVEHKKLTITVTRHNLLFIKDMSATYELTETANGHTKLVMTSYNSFSPKLMKYLMRGQLTKSVAKHLFGMKYFIETGKTVSMDEYAKVFKAYE